MWLVLVGVSYKIENTSKVISYFDLFLIENWTWLYVILNGTEKKKEKTCGHIPIPQTLISLYSYNSNFLWLSFRLLSKLLPINMVKVFFSFCFSTLIMCLVKMEMKIGWQFGKFMYFLNFFCSIEYTTFILCFFFAIRDFSSLNEN